MNENNFWKEVLSVVRISVSSANFSTWFAQTFVVSVKKIENGRQIIEIGCASPFARDTLEKRYFGILQDAVNQVTGIKNDLVFIIRQNPNPPVGRRASKQTLSAPLFVEEDEELHIEQLKKAGIPDGFSFDNFAVSSSNQLAWTAADAVSKKPGVLYNPLFLWGGVGVGKTHLAVATARSAFNNFPEKKVLYSTGDDFIVGIIEAIRTKTTSEFKKKYRNINVLIVDDIQFIAGKDAVQDEFFHTFNVIKKSGGQVIMTADHPPGEILRLEPRLRNRFEAGLIVDIEPPDFGLRVAIILIKAKERGIPITTDTAQKIAQVFSDARQIEGFINRLLAQNSRQNILQVDGFIEELLGKETITRARANGERKFRASPKEVINVICKYFSISQKQLIGKSRKRSLVKPRHILMYFLRQEMHFTLEEVGKITGGRDHTTIIHGVNNITAQINVKRELYEDILGIKQKLWG